MLGARRQGVQSEEKQAKTGREKRGMEAKVAPARGVFSPPSSAFATLSRPLARKSRLFHKGTLLELDILDVAYGGKGIAKVPTEDGDFTVFVPNAIRGQRVRARVSLCKRRHAEARITAVLKRAPGEVETPYQAIPGAPYITLPLEAQREWKERTTLDVYRRIGGVPDLDARYAGWVDSPSGFHYRNKMEYSFAAIGRSPGDDPDAEFEDGFFLGFKARGTWWAVENLEGDSGLFDPTFEPLVKDIRRWCEDSGLPPRHAPKREGFFRFLVVRRSLSEDELLVNLVTTSDGLDRFDSAGFAEKLQDKLGGRLAGFVHTLNDDTGERVEDPGRPDPPTLGRDHVVEQLHGLDFEIRMRSFFQTNPRCAERLYAQVMAYAYAEPLPEADAPPGDHGPVLRHGHHRPAPLPPRRSQHHRGRGRPHRGGHRRRAPKRRTQWRRRHRIPRGRRRAVLAGPSGIQGPHRHHRARPAPERDQPQVPAQGDPVAGQADRLRQLQPGHAGPGPHRPP